MPLSRYLVTRAAWRGLTAALLLTSLAWPGAALALAAPPAVPLTSCTLVVNTIADTGAGSLRNEVGCATDGQTVTFAVGLAGQTISLTGGEIVTNQSITIDGSAAAGVIVDAGNLSRIFNFQGAGTVTITGLILQHGRTAATSLGGAIVTFSSQLVLNQVQVLSNTADIHGGGIFAAPAVTITNGLFQGNQCTGSSCNGGGIYSGNLTLFNTNFISNTSQGSGGGASASAIEVTVGRFERNTCLGAACNGGGLSAGTTLQVTSAQFITNTSQGAGGGAYASAAVSLSDSLFQGNICFGNGCAGGGLATTSLLTLVETDFISNTSQGDGGGAVSYDLTQATGGRFERNSCLTNACYGGGLNTQSAVLTDTQFLTNTSRNQGGGLSANGPAVLTGVRLAGNSCLLTGCFGGGLRAADTLTLVNTDIISNTSQGSGGGALVSGAASLTNSLFLRNTCLDSFCYAGGLWAGATLAVADSEFISNTSDFNGAGVRADQAVTLTNSLFQGNQCQVSFCGGGGLFANATVVATNTAFISNTSQSGGGGGALAGGSITLTGSRFEGNRCLLADCLGGGLLADSAASLTNSSFSGNSADSGGGLAALAGLTAANLTFSGNTATVAGGAISLTESVSAQLLNLTLADNTAPSGGALAAPSSATVGVSNTVISTNGAAACAGVIDFGTHNLEWASTSCAAAGPTAGFSNADPLLGPLALNAPGATLTRALLTGSPARDSGDAATCAGPLVNNRDQRGVTRPIDGDGVGGAVCDLGAFEAALNVWLLYLPLILR